MKTRMPSFCNLLKCLTFAFCFCVVAGAGAQPWTTGLRIASSTDGWHFDQPRQFQDSCGVPSAVQWHGDTAVCVFQWAREPLGSPTWDRVAVKFSYDGGEQWTNPEPVVFENFPDGFQRPFDPTLTVLADNSLRMYFSGSLTVPPPGQDSLVNTYSAHSTDGIHFAYEPGARVDHPTQRVIDPAVTFFNNMWHYESPAGAPQDGAFHYISGDGLTFTQVANIPADPAHNWTGNYLVDSDSELRFYGTGPQMWYNSTSNGGEWSGYVSCGIPGADPTVVKLDVSRYFAIFVGPLLTDVNEPAPIPNDLKVFPAFPNPFNSSVAIRFELNRLETITVEIASANGRRVVQLLNEQLSPGSHIVRWHAGPQFGSGVYFCTLSSLNESRIQKIILVK